MSAESESGQVNVGGAADQLWAGGQALDRAIHEFTVDEDPVLDPVLMPWDVIGSAAHVRMLEHSGLLATADAGRLLDALRELHREAREGSLRIRPEQEDGHTALEQALSDRVGNAGRRVHLGRSRNDQVILALRLYLRDALLHLGGDVADMASAFVEFGERHDGMVMPGYTHMRRAMPSSVSQWSLAFAEGLIEELEALESVWARLDRCPLGAAAGFGVPLPIDREHTAELLGFTRVQRNPIDVISSRGRHELALLQWLASVGGVLEKYLWDLAVFSTGEYGIVDLPEAFTTGSSIMPQKRNPDVVELARARCRELRGLAGQLEQLAGGLPSSYHRDSQLMKAPVLRAVQRARGLFAVLKRLIPAVVMHPERLQAACSDELYAAHEASRRASEGLPFRDAYAQVGAEIRNGSFKPDRDQLSTAVDQNGRAPACWSEITAAGHWLEARRVQTDRCLEGLWTSPEDEHSAGV